MSALETSRCVPICCPHAAPPLPGHQPRLQPHSEDEKIEALGSAGIAKRPSFQRYSRIPIGCSPSGGSAMVPKESGCSRAGCWRGCSGLIPEAQLTAVAREASALPVSIVFLLVWAPNEQPGCRPPWHKPVQRFAIAIGYCNKQSS